MTPLSLTLTRPLVFLPGIVASIAIAAIGVFLMMPAPEAVAATVPLAAVEKSASGRDRNCESCGFIQTIRRTDPATGLPAYAFSVRMRDGSTRESTGTTRGRWIEGERVVLIGGVAARALEEQKNSAL